MRMPTRAEPAVPGVTPRLASRYTQPILAALERGRIALPPRPPSPPSGPPWGTNFSRRKLADPLPPSPAIIPTLM